MPETGTQKQQAHRNHLQRRIFNWTDIQHKRLSQRGPVQEEPLRHYPGISEHCQTYWDLCEQGWKRLPDRRSTVLTLKKQPWRKSQLSPLHLGPGHRNIFVRLQRLGRQLQTLSTPQHVLRGPLGLLQRKGQQCVLTPDFHRHWYPEREDTGQYQGP